MEAPLRQSDSRAKEIFAEAADLSPDQRARVMDDRCRDDASLLAEVQALLDAHDQAGRFLADPTAAMIPSRDHSSEPRHEPLPRQIGRYKLFQVIGEGGFGTVYMAEQEHPIRRRVALKVIKLGMDTKQVIARFEAERQALALMDHPNVARVLDAGATDSGRPYFVMELVNGVPITQYCDGNRLTTRQRLDLFLPVCQAVQHAHTKGIIHRDLKPSNVLVTLHDGVPVPKVIDFGIAKATQQRLTEKTLFTEFRHFIGTPEYMSPEQAETSGLDIDTRTDVYALGVLLYELLTGTTPFDAGELRNKAYGEMQRIIREVEPPRPSTRLATLGKRLSTIASQRQTDAARLDRLVRRELDWVVMKCLEKDRTRRYETASALAADVRRHLDNEPVLARPATAGYRFRKFVSRHKAGATAMAAVTLALVLGTAGTTIGLLRAKAAQGKAEAAEKDALTQRNAAVSARGVAELQAKRATEALDFMRSILGSAQAHGPAGPGGRSGADVRLADVLDQFAARLDHVKGQPRLELDGRVNLAKAYDSLGLYFHSSPQHDRALELSRALSGADSKETLEITAESLFAVASTFDKQRNLRAEPLARQTVADCRRVFGLRHAVTFEALNAHGLILRTGGRADEAEAIFRELISTATAEPKVHQPKGTARYYSNLGRIVGARGRFEEAEELHRLAIEIARGEAQTDPIRTVWYTDALVLDLLGQRKFADAEKASRAAHEHSVKALGESHPQTTQTGESLAEILVRNAKYREAIPLYEIRQRHAGDPNEALAWRHAIAQLHLLAGDEPAARRLWAGLLGDVRSRIAAMPANSLDDDALEQIDRLSWASANVLLGLRPDEPWSSRALHEHAVASAFAELKVRAFASPPLDAYDWTRLTFRLDRWDGAGQAPAAPVLAGEFAALRAAPDPDQGLYLFSLHVPSRSAIHDLRVSQWVLIADWEVSLHWSYQLQGAPVDLAVAEMYLSPDTVPTEEAKWRAVAFTRPWSFHGLPFPGRGHDSYVVRAQARLALPPGSYQPLYSHDGACRVFLDGQRVYGKWGDQDFQRPGLVEFGATPRELMCHHAQGGGELLVALYPMAVEATAMMERGYPSKDLALTELGRLDFFIAKSARRKQPEQGAYWQGKSALLARAGQLDRALSAIDRAIELNPAEPFYWALRATLLAYSGDLDAFRRHSDEMLKRFGRDQDVFVSSQVCASALLLPPAGEHLDAALAAAERSLKTAGPVQRYAPLDKGIAEFRAAQLALSQPQPYPARAGVHLAAARQHLEAVKVEGFLGDEHATRDLFLAMTMHLSGDPAARQVFSRPDAFLKGRAVSGPGRNVTDFAALFWWLRAQIAHREATQLFSGASTRPATTPAQP